MRKHQAVFLHLLYLFFRRCLLSAASAAFGFYRKHVLEHGVELHRDKTVHVTLAEEPFPILALLDDILEKGVDLQTLLDVHSQAVLQRCRRFVGDDVVHLGVVFVQIMDGTADLGVCGLFPLPPVPTLPEFEVLAVAAAECKKGAVVNGEDLAAHHVKNIRCDQMRPAATPSDCAETLFQDVEIFVAAVYKSDCERHFTQFFQILFFLAGTVPDKTEVTADNENIAGFQFFENGIFES